MLLHGIQIHSCSDMLVQVCVRRGSRKNSSLAPAHANVQLKGMKSLSLYPQLDKKSAKMVKAASPVEGWPREADDGTAKGPGPILQNGKAKRQSARPQGKAWPWPVTTDLLQELLGAKGSRQKCTVHSQRQRQHLQLPSPLSPSSA